MKLTPDLVQEMCKCGCPNRDQLALLKLTPPLSKGWIQRLVGVEISEQDWQRVLSFRGLSPGKRKRVMRLEKQAELL